MTTRTVEVQLPPNEAWEKLKAAASSIGRVEEAHDESRFLMVKARYGLNPVRLRVSVLTGPSGSTSVLDVQGRGQDVWGVASRKVIDRLCAAVDGNRISEAGWMPDPSGRYPNRWWDGVQWTVWVRDKPGGTRSEDPPGSLPPPIPLVSQPQADIHDALPSDAIEQLRQLGELRDGGVITLEQFEAKREELLRRI